MSKVFEERAAMFERSRAFNAVVNLRADLVVAESKLAGLEAQGRHCRPDVLKLTRDHVATLRGDVQSAEAYCRDINSEQLAAHDEVEQQRAEAEQQAHEIALAEKDATLEANRTANAALMAERLKDRMRQKAYQDELAAEAEAEATCLKREVEEAEERRRQIAAQRLANRTAEQGTATL
jgi:hypothetical protein